MTKFPLLGKGDLTPAQQTLWDELTLGPRGFYTGGEEARRLPDLYNAWLQFPEYGSLQLQVADQLRQQSELCGKFRELIILTTSAQLNARVEYDFHIPFARNEGLSDPVITAIGEGETPPFRNEGERIVYQANIELLRSATLSEETREEVVTLMGYRGLMQLIAAVTLYSMVAYTTNVAGVQLAEDFSADPAELKNFFANRESGEET